MFLLSQNDFFLKENGMVSAFSMTVSGFIDTYIVAKNLFAKPAVVADHKKKK